MDPSEMNQKVRNGQKGAKGAPKGRMAHRA
jgi:hypothetical protein